MTQIIYWSSTCITLSVVTIFYREEILTTKKGYQIVMTINYCNISINSDCFKIVFFKKTLCSFHYREKKKDELFLFTPS